MTNTTLLVLRAVLTLAFLWYGGTKLLGTPSAVALYDALGYGQGVRYVTGSAEVAGALLLWLPGRQALGALILTVTMLAGLSAMLIIIGGAWAHLAALLVLSALALFAYRGQLTGDLPRT